MSQSLILLGKPILFNYKFNSERKQWIQLVPAGTVETVDDRGPFYVKNLQSIIKASFANAKATHWALPVDYEHSIDIAAPKGQPAPAAGWISEMQARDDGIWGLVEWTPKAFNQIKDREYRFLSPVLGSNLQNDVQLIVRESLTNNPAITLVSLNSVQKENLMENDNQFRVLPS